MKSITNRILIFSFMVFMTSCKKEKHEPKFEKNQIEHSKYFEKIQIFNTSLECRGIGTQGAEIYGSGVTMYFTIQNNTNLGINRIYLEGKYKFSDRNYIYKEEINYEFRKGLEPSERQEISMKPGIFSDWNDKIKPGDNGEFTLNLLKAEDYNGNIFTKTN